MWVFMHLLRVWISMLAWTFLIMHVYEFQALLAVKQEVIKPETHALSCDNNMGCWVMMCEGQMVTWRGRLKTSTTKEKIRPAESSKYTEPEGEQCQKHFRYRHSRECSSKYTQPLGMKLSLITGSRRSERRDVFLLPFPLNASHLDEFKLNIQRHFVLLSNQVNSEAGLLRRWWQTKYSTMHLACCRLQNPELDRIHRKTLTVTERHKASSRDVHQLEVRRDRQEILTKLNLNLVWLSLKLVVLNITHYTKYQHTHVSLKSLQTLKVR